MEVFDKQKPLISEEYAPPTRRKAVSVGSNTRNHIFGYLESDNKQSNFSFFVKFLPSKFCSTNIESFPLKNIRYMAKNEVKSFYSTLPFLNNFFKKKEKEQP